MHPSRIILGIGCIAVGIAVAVFISQESEPTSHTVSTGSSSVRTMDVTGSVPTDTPQTDRTIRTTNGVKHSIPLDEIVSGGPGKDGIPSIDAPRFIDTRTADQWMNADDPGLGIEMNGAARFYPYRILVWHEIVNDTVKGTPILVTYCPLCRTGIVFDPVVNGVAMEFGVSGKLWQSNLLMYNRATNSANESYWSQVLGEAVKGPHTGIELDVLESDTMTYKNWKQTHPNTKVLSRKTGTRRDYSRDPYEGYYESERVMFGKVTDNRLHPKTVVLGIEVDGSHKAYPVSALPVGTTHDTLEGTPVTITKTETGEIRIKRDGETLSYIRGFWFSWVAAHPDSHLWHAD